MISFNGSQMISLKENYTLQDFTYKLAVQELEELEITDIADQKEHLRRRLLHDISQVGTIPILLAICHCETMVMLSQAQLPTFVPHYLLHCHTAQRLTTLSCLD